MEMFLWTVGSFYVFGEKLDLTWVFKSKSSFLSKTHISSLLARWKVPSSAMWAKAFILFEKGVHFLEKGVYFFEIAIVEIWWAR